MPKRRHLETDSLRAGEATVPQGKAARVSIRVGGGAWIYPGG